MKKYLALFEISWSSGFVYRVNFMMWRVRMVLQLLTVYFLWLAVLQRQPNVFGYDATTLLTYVVGTSFIRAVVFSSRSIEMQRTISSGELNNFLVRPINIFGYWLTRDVADKLLNVLFSMVEVFIFLVLLRPPIIGPASPLDGVIALITLIMAALLYSFFSFIISTTVFWMSEGNGWPQRFVIFVLTEFLAGALFPLDILPKPIFEIISRLPTAYFLFTPMQIYLGRLDYGKIVESLLLMALWMVVLRSLAKRMYNKGLKVYGAYGS